MNRMNNRTPRLAAFGLMLVAIAACTKTDIKPNDDLANGLNPSSGAPIAFEAKDAFTKAVINNKADLEVEGNAFRVWSWFQGTTSGAMFETAGTPVTYAEDENGDLNWTYTPPRYWMNGTYDFAAVYPKSATGTYVRPQNSSTSVLTVTGFDVTNQDDLLVAFNTGIDGGKGNANGPVNLTFQHALSCVQIELQLNAEDFFEPTPDGGEREVGYAYVEALGFSDISVVGTLSATQSNNNVSLEWAESTDKGVLSYNYETPKQVERTKQNFLGDNGLLVIPQALSEGYLYMRVRIDFPGITGSIYNVYEVPLSTGVSEWLPDTKYLYKGTVGQDLTIEFSVTRINNWLDNTLGGFNIGGDNNK